MSEYRKVNWYNEELDKEGISQWFNYKGFTYIMKK